MAKRKTLTFALFLVFALSLCLFTASFSTMKKAAAETEWTLDKWELVEDGGEQVYNATGNKADLRKMTLSSVGENNKLTFDFKIGDCTGERYVQVTLTSLSGHNLKFVFKPMDEAMYIYSENDKLVGRNHDHVNTGSYYTVSIEAGKNQATFSYANMSIIGDYATTDFTNATLVIQAQNILPSIKNISLEKVQESEIVEGWTANENVTENSGVYTTNNRLATIEYKSKDFSKINTIEAEFKYQGDKTTGDREYAGIIVYSKNDYYRFAIWPNSASNGPAVLFVQKNTEDPISRFIRKELAADKFGKNVWYKMKVVLEDDYFALYLNDELICTNLSLDVNVGEFPWSRAMIISKGCPTEMKNASVSLTEVEKPEPVEGWAANGNVTEENGVYTTNNQTAIIEYNSKDFSKTNTVEAEFKYQGDSTTGNIEYAGIVIYSNKDYYRFSIWPNTASNGPAVLFVQKNTEDPISRFIRKELSADKFGKNVWYKMKVVLEDDYFALYLNDELICTNSSLDVTVGTFPISRILVTSKGCPTQMRNLSLSYTKPDFSSYLDFEFNDARGVSAFTATDATLAWEDGVMKVGLSGNAEITSPHIFVNGGNKYSVKLGVRNTFVVRMKNDSAATALKLYFLMKGDSDYIDSQSKTFDIIPNSDYTTYYFNLSDVVDCDCWQSNSTLKMCEHYLSGFKFAFEGADNGTVEIDEISFSREARIYEYGATEMTATANAENDTVTVSGKLLEKFAGKTVTVLETSVQNYNQTINFGDNVKLASAKANGVDFKVTFPFTKGNMNHLSSKFLAVVSDGEDYIGGTKLSEMFMIENWRDFSENPYAFTLKSLEVKVTDEQFGAKGDGFTNDTAAIQNAIDYVSAQGGGTVIVPGNSDTYGRRYIMTGVKLKNNVELRIETGAILWQSHRESDYTEYAVYRGHENMGQSVAWGLSALMHLPFIYIRDVENVRVTGGGTIRMDDTGTEWLDGNGYSWDSNITVGCKNVIHLVPIGIYGSKNVEISDINVRRCSCWHAYIRESSNVYFGNVDLAEVNCINGDGFDFSTAVNNVVVDRCNLYSNDDALVLAVTTNDPRDDLSIWREKSKKADKSLHDFKVVNSNLFGGHGITFIPWASDCSDQYSVRIYNIHVENCVLGGTSTAVGVWADNPFYGKSNYWDGTYGSTDAVEDGDYSPVSDVTIINNKYVSACSFYGVNITNVVTDMKTIGAQNFENGDFDKKVHNGRGFSNETKFVTGLSYWGSVGNVGVEKIGTKQVLTVDTKETVTIDDYAGYIDGNGSLYQGIYKLFGNYYLNMKVKLVSGSAKLFVIDAVTGDLLAEKVIDATSEEFVLYSLPFGILKNSTVQLGIEHIGEDGTKVYIDDASVTDDENSNPYVVEGTEYNYDFEKDYKEFTTYTTSAAKAEVKGGKLVFESTGEVKYMWNNVKPLSAFEVTMNVTVKDRMNVGLYLFATNVSPEPDNINAYNVQFEKDGSGYRINLHKFSGAFEGMLTGNPIEVSGNSCTIRVVVLNSTILVFVDGSTKPIFVYEVPENLAGNIGIRSQYQASEINSLKIISGEAQLAAGDSSKLNTLINTAKTYKEYDYTEATYSVLKTALEEAEKTVGLTQYKIDKAYETLYNALMSLERLPAGDKTQLNALIATAKGVDQSKYTADSYAALKNALKVVEDLDENATQGAIDEAYKALDEAYKALEEKPTDPDTDSSTDSGNTSDSGTTTDSGNKGNKKGCKGGIETSSVMFFMLGMVAVYLVGKKRRVNE